MGAPGGRWTAGWATSASAVPMIDKPSLSFTIGISGQAKGPALPSEVQLQGHLDGARRVLLALGHCSKGGVRGIGVGRGESHVIEQVVLFAAVLQAEAFADGEVLVDAGMEGERRGHGQYPED